MATTEAANPTLQTVPSDSNADYKRAVRYLLGDGVTQNLLSSQEFFHKAAQQGHSDAADILSLLPLKKPASVSGWIKRYRRAFIAGALLPVFLLIFGLAVLPMWPSSSSPSPEASPVRKTSARIPATGGNHGHRR